MDLSILSYRGSCFSSISEYRIHAAIWPGIQYSALHWISKCKPCFSITIKRPDDRCRSCHDLDRDGKSQAADATSMDSFTQQRHDSLCICRAIVPATERAKTRWDQQRVHHLTELSSTWLIFDQIDISIQHIESTWAANIKQMQLKANSDFRQSSWRTYLALSIRTCSNASWAKNSQLPKLQYT